jgi:hypothetical protein
MSLPSYTSGGSASTAPAPYKPPAAPQPYLPNATWTNASWTKPVAGRDSLAATATRPEDQQIQIAGDGAPIPVIYGPGRPKALLCDALTYQGNMVFLIAWCEGEIEAVDTLYMGGKPLPAGVTATHYTGTAGQVADPILVAAYASHGVTYADALPGIAYSRITVSPGASEGFPTFTADIRGRKLYDPRTETTVYSDNPALALADATSSTVYGFGKTVDWDSVSAVANDDDALVGGEKRRIIGLVCDAPGNAGVWIDTLRTYASCFVVMGDAGLKLISDRPGTSVMSFTASNAKNLKIKKAGIQQVPTVMRIEYTDTTVTPWRTGTAEVLAAGVAEGTTPRRPSTVSLPGLHRYSQAWREGVERMNKLTLGDLSMEFGSFDEAGVIEVGDITDMTHPIGLAAKLVRINAVSSRGPGSPVFGAFEYDPAMYSDVVQAEPTYADTNLPSPADPPEITGLLAVEEVYQLENGNYASRLRATWDDADYPYLAHYRIEIIAAGVLIQSGSPGVADWPTPPIKEGVEYQVKVAAVTTIGATGTWAQYNIIPLGKSLIPGDVPSLTAFEAGGRVYATAGAAVDIDILRYEWRYWPVGGAWATGTVIDRADALRMQTDTMPVGTWVLGVKAIDSILQYSANAKTAPVVVTSDANSFFIASYDSNAPTLTNMVAYTLGRDDPHTYYVTDDGVAWNDKFPNAMDTYTNALFTYHGSITSSWLGEGEDFGLLLGGNWMGEATVEAINGSLVSYLGLSSDGSSYSYAAGLSQKANARFARLKHEALTTSTMRVTAPTQTIRLDAVPRSEVVDFVTSASTPTLIQLDGVYVAAKKIIPTLEGATARTASYDRVLLAPVHGLQIEGTITASGYAFYKISNAGSRVVLADDYLEYDVFSFIGAQSVAGRGGVEIDFTDGTWMRGMAWADDVNGTGRTDQPNTLLPVGQWFSRKHPMSGAAGKTVLRAMTVLRPSATGTYKAAIRNIRITDGAGVTRLQLWSSGEPSLNTLDYSSGITQSQCGPANSLWVRAFNAADGVQISSPGKLEFQGV